MPSFTFYASVEATVNAGATPVFCDVDPATFCVTRETVEAAITDRTRAIVAVDLFGWLPPLDELRDLGLPILEDAAQAHGALRDGRRSGTFGDAATFSFFPSKNLGALGDAGAIVTDSDDVAEVARRLRFHGSTDKVTYTEVGYNSRLDELQAAVLRELLPELDGWNDARRGAARAYAERGLGDVPGIELPHFDDEREHVFHLYVVRHPDADALAAALAERQVGARATTAGRCTSSPRWSATAASGSTCPAPPRPRARTSRCRWAPQLSESAGRRGDRRVRIWVDLTNSPHVLVMRPLIEAMRADGHEVEVTARDFAQTLQLLERFGMEHTAIGRHRGGRLLDKAVGLFDRSLALARWGRSAASTSRWGTARTT